MSRADVVLLHGSFKSWGGAEALVAAHARLLGRAAVSVEVAALRHRIDPCGRDAFDHAPLTQWKRSLLESVLSFRPEWAVPLRARRAAALWKGAGTVVAYNDPAPTALGLGPPGPVKHWQCNEPRRRLYPTAANPWLARRAEEFRNGTIAPPDIATRTFLARLASDAEPTRRREAAAHAANERRAAEAFETVWSISAFGRDNVRAAIGRCDDVPLPPCVDALPAVRKRRPSDRPAVLAVSRLEAEKNVDTLMRGFLRFRRIRPTAVLHIVGTGSVAEELRRMTTEEAAPGAVQFHGRLDADELAELRARCDVFALVPADEPFGMVFAEAAIAGQAVVGPSHGGPNEILDGGRLGWTADAFDPGDIASALERAFGADDTERERRRNAAAEACRDRYGAERIGAALRTKISRGGVRLSG